MVILIILTIFAIVLIISARSQNSFNDSCKDAGYSKYISNLKACVDKEGKLHFGKIDDSFINSFTYGYQFKFEEFKDE